MTSKKFIQSLNKYNLLYYYSVVKKETTKRHEIQEKKSIYIYIYTYSCKKAQSVFHFESLQSS